MIGQVGPGNVVPGVEDFVAGAIEIHAIPVAISRLEMMNWLGNARPHDISRCQHSGAVVFLFALVHEHLTIAAQRQEQVPTHRVRSPNVGVAGVDAFRTWRPLLYVLAAIHVYKWNGDGSDSGVIKLPER